MPQSHSVGTYSTLTKYGRHAKETFPGVPRMDKDSDKADKIFFHLGIIYKQQQKYEESFKLEIGHADKRLQHRQKAYKRMLKGPNHAKSFASRRCIAMAVTQHSGAASAPFITTSTSSTTPSMPIRVLSA
ncbi:hypothetical protein FRC10_004708 [Ceratobasidium sp. 414]|nr:hypothetical protein FRC10_004708 [Ceratobasidium sp. 414]